MIFDIWYMIYGYDILSPTAECYRVFAQYRFRCVLGELGRFREGTGFREPVPGTGSGNQFWEPNPGFDGFRQVLRFQGSGSERCVKEVSKVSVFDGFRGVRFCSQRFDGTVSGNRVPGTEGIKKVPGQGFRQLLCTSTVYSCTLKVYFCTLKVCFWTLKVYLLCFARKLFHVESMLSCFESIILYLESMPLYVESWKYLCVIWRLTLVRWKYTLNVCFCTLTIYFRNLKVCFCSLKVQYIFCKLKYIVLYFESILLITFVLWTLNVYFCTFKVHFWTFKIYLLYFARIYFCTLPQCLSKEKVVINLYTLRMQTSLLLGIPPTLIFFISVQCSCMGPDPVLSNACPIVKSFFDKAAYCQIHWSLRTAAQVGTFGWR